MNTKQTTAPNEKELEETIIFNLFNEVLEQIQNGTADNDEILLADFCKAYNCTKGSPLYIFFKGFTVGATKGLELAIKIDEMTRASNEK